jgi:cell division septal protein FtsQ
MRKGRKLYLILLLMLLFVLVLIFLAKPQYPKIFLDETISITGRLIRGIIDILK